MRALESPLTRRWLVGVDAACWFLAAMILVAARYDFTLNRVTWWQVGLYAVAAATLQLVVGYGVRLYRGAARVGSFNEAMLVTKVVGVIGVAVGLSALIGFRDFPRGVVITVPIGALAFMAAARFLGRAVVVRSLQRAPLASREGVLIYGAGNAGRQLGQLIFDDPDAPYRVIGLIDDDLTKRYLRFDFGKVVGDRESLVEIARKWDVRTVILAIPSAPAAFLATLSDELEESQLKLLVLPPVRDIVGGRVQLDHLHEFAVSDLLGRSPVEADLGAIAGYLRDKVVLVTGAGGSIGAEIARQVHGFGPRELICLDRDESGLHSVQLSIYGTGLLDTPDMALCDIRDREALQEVFDIHRPDVVFHAAALKHLPMLEQYPEEGWKTNVLGTLNVLECAAAAKVRHFVNISTDKAADATSVLGRTKRRAEELTSWFAAQGHGHYLSVRFGNVLGSRGSVVHTFRAQIARGGPVTVVDPEITRFFMTIPEACQLVIQAGAIGDPGSVLVLDMGEPIKIVDVARRLIAESGKSVDIVYTGLRRGEKMHEVLFSDSEVSLATAHPLISRVCVPPVDPELVRTPAGSAGRTPASHLRLASVAAPGRTA